MDKQLYTLTEILIDMLEQFTTLGFHKKTTTETLDELYKLQNKIKHTNRTTKVIKPENEKVI